MRFQDFAEMNGVLIRDLIADDRIHRCATLAHPRTKNGSYRFDGRSGWVFAWDGEARAISFNDPNARPLTEAEQARRDAKRQLVRDEQAILHRKAAEWAARLLTLAKPAEHGYLYSKGFKTAQGLVLPDGELFIPMRDVRNNDLIGAQIVKWLPEELRWEKKYLYGMRSRGACLRIGPARARELVLCEGYATSLSLVDAITTLRLSMRVVCCFSAHNIITVAKHFSPGAAGVFADNDQNGVGVNAGIKSGLPYVVADEPGFDANDLHVAKGVFAVAAKLNQLRAAMSAARAAV